MDSQSEIVILKNGEEIVLSDKRLKELVSKFIELCAADAVLFDDFNKNVKVVDLLVNVKKAFFPATQMNLSMSTQNFDDKLKRWVEEREKLKEAIDR